MWAVILALGVAGAQDAALVPLSAQVVPGSPTSSERLTCEVAWPVVEPPPGRRGWRPPEPPPVVYRWTRGSSTLPSTGPVLWAGAVAAWDEVACAVAPIGADGSPGAWVASPAVTVRNGAPWAGSVALLPGGARATDPLVCDVGALVDPDGDAVTLAFTWTVDGVAQDEIGWELAPGAFRAGQVVACTVAIQDPFVFGAPITVSRVIANTPPVVEGVVVGPAGATAGDTLVCGTGGTSDADGDPVTVSTAWSRPAPHRRGDVVTCTATPSDGRSTGAPQHATITIADAPPVLAGVTLSPATPRAGEPIRCAPGAVSDPDGDAVTLAIAWTVDGAPAGVGDTLPGARKGQTVTCTVTPSSGVAGAPVSATALVGNTAPTGGVARVEPEVPDATRPLTCAATGATDADGDVVRYDVRWELNGADVGAQAPPVKRGDRVACVATPTDGVSSGTPARSAVAVVRSSPPALAGVSLEPATAKTTDTLVCVPGAATDPDGDVVTARFAWSIDGVPTADTGPTLAAGRARRGQDVVCEATPHDGDVAGAPVRATITIANTPPAIEPPALTPLSPTSADTLTCDAGKPFDADKDPVAFDVAWEVAGAPVPGGRTLAGAFRKGDVVRCLVTPSDPAGPGAAVASAPVTVRDAAPRASAATIAPASPRGGDALTCTATGTDPDGDAITWKTRWSVDGTAVGEGALTAPRKGATVVCEAVPVADGVSGASARTAVTIANAPPTVGAVTVSPASPATDQDLTCAAAVTDLDGDRLAPRYTWTGDGAPVGEGSTLPAARTRKGVAYVCAVAVSDGEVEATGASAAVTVVDGPPRATSAAITPASAVTGDTLTCVGVGTDPDGDPVTFAYTWSSGATGPTTTGRKGEALTCTATPEAGGVSGAAATSAAVVVRNSPPRGGTASAPPSVTTLDAVSCAADGATDPDGDAVSWRYRWTGPATVEGASLPADRTARGQTWTCAATPSDGAEDGAAVTAVVTIANTPPAVTAVTLTPATPRAGDAVRCAATTADVDGDRVAVTYTWSTGASGETLPAGTPRGTTVTCTATPSDGAAGAAMSATATVGNTPPSGGAATVTPAVADATTPLSCATSGGADVDGDPVTWSIRWELNGADVGAAVPAVKRGDRVACVATPSDGTDAGTPVRAAVLTIGSAPPSLASVAIEPATPKTTDALVCLPGAASDPDGDAVSARFVWTVDGARQSEGGPTLPAGRARRGQAVTCEATPHDGAVAGRPVGASVTIGNTLPTASPPTITPASATAADVLTCVPGTATDADRDAVTVDLAWEVAGRRVATPTAKKGEAVRCLATPRDPEGAGAEVASAVLTIRDAPPVATAASITPSAPTATDTPTCAGTGTDPDGDPVTWRVRWTVDGRPVDAPAARKGATVACEAIPVADGVEGGAARATARIVNTPPTASGAAITPASPATDEDLTCAATTADVDGDRLTLSVTWTADGAALPDTGATLPASKTRKGVAYACAVVASDGESSSAAARSAAVTVVNGPPRVTSVSVSPASPRSRDPLTCAAVAVDPDDDPVTVEVSWTVGVMDILDAGTTLPAGRFDAGDAVKCVATPSDGTRTGSAVASAPVTVRNSPPSGGTVSLLPAAPSTSDALVCTADDATDPDADPVTYQIRWKRDGRAVAEGGTLEASSTRKGQAWTCEATPFDGREAGEPLVASVTIANTPPGVVGADITPSSPRATDTLTCTTGEAWDDDGDRVTLRYAWTIDGVPASDTTRTLPPARTKKGQSVACAVTPWDGTDAGPTIQSSAVEVVNTPPKVASAKIDLAHPTTVDTVRCLPGGASDADGDPVELRVRWTINGKKVEGDSDTLTGDAFLKDQVLVCTPVPWDGEEEGEGVSSPRVFVENIAPVVTSVRIEPDVLYTHTTATVVAEADDPDEHDDAFLHVSWYIDGKKIDVDGDRLTGVVWFDRGNRVVAEVMPTDGELNGTPMRSAEVVVRNAPPESPTIALAAPKKAADALQCAITKAAEDRDADVLRYRFEWTVDGRPFADAVTGTLAGDTVPSGAWTGGERWTCTVTASDGTEGGPPVSATVQTVAPQVGGGTAHGCALDRLGKLHCWGGAALAVSKPPKGFFTRLAVGAGHACAIDGEGALACWGEDDAGESRPPPGRYVDVAAGEGFGCALDADGVVKCWGAGPALAAPGGRFTAITAGARHACALDGAGSAVCWGDGKKGQTTAPTGAFVALDGGVTHTCGVRKDKTVACWGTDKLGESAAPTGWYSEVRAGDGISCARAGNGAVQCWGRPDDGVLEVPKARYQTIGVGARHACGFTDEDQVRCWGANDAGQSGAPMWLN